MDYKIVFLMTHQKMQLLWASIEISAIIIIKYISKYKYNADLTSVAIYLGYNGKHF